LISKINDLKNLRDNWDGFGGTAPSQDEINIFKKAATEMLKNRFIF